MADIELVIKIPEEAKQAFDCAESNDLKGCYYDHGGVVGNAIKNGTPLPKGHGRLIDADKAIREENSKLVDFETTNTRDRSYCRYARVILNNAQTIIEADRAENEDKT